MIVRCSPAAYARQRLDTGRDLVFGLMPALAPTSRMAISFMVTEGVLVCSEAFWEALQAAYGPQSAELHELASASQTLAPRECLPQRPHLLMKPSAFPGISFLFDRAKGSLQKEQRCGNQ